MTNQEKHIIKRVHKEAKELFAYEPNDAETHFKIQEFFRSNLPFVKIVKCDNENNTPDTIDRGFAYVQLDDLHVIVGGNWTLTLDPIEKKFKVHHDDQPNEVMDEVTEALEAFGLEVTSEFSEEDVDVTYTIRLKQ